jgi:hypothetical protein
MGEGLNKDEAQQALSLTGDREARYGPVSGPPWATVRDLIGLRCSLTFRHDSYQSGPPAFER